MDNRITHHPILGKYEKGKKIQFHFDGRLLEGYQGEPIAVALKANGVVVHRRTTRRHEPRGVFCAIGRCTDCVMVVNGITNVRTCVEPLQDGMVVQTQIGLAAAKEETEIGNI